MTPIERMTPEQLAELRRAYEQWVTDGRPGDKLPPSLIQLFRQPMPIVLHPAQYALYVAEVESYQRRTKRKAFEKAEAEWCTHVGPVPMPNRAERRRMAALKRRAKR